MFEVTSDCIVAFIMIDSETLTMSIRMIEDISLITTTAIDRSPDYILQDLTEMAIQASSTCHVGQFIVDVRDGQVLCQTELPLRDVDEHDLFHLLRPLIIENIAAQRLFLPSFLKIIKSDVPPSQAMENAGSHLAMHDKNNLADLVLFSSLTISRQQTREEINIEHLNIIKVVGRGSLGTVFTCQYRGIEVALKKVNKLFVLLTHAY